MDEALYQRGLARLHEADGGSIEALIDRLDAVAPDLGRYIVEFGFGEIYSRPRLSLGERELAAVAALAAIGGAQPQLKVHIGAALNVGLSDAQIVEVLIQTAFFSGFPAAINALLTAKDVFDEYATRQPDSDRAERR